MSDYMNIRPVAWIAGPKKRPELARLQWSATLAPHDVGRGYVVTPLVTAESAQAEITRLTAEAAELRRERDEARRDRDMLRLCMNDAACRALVSERDELRRWKSTNAPRLDALEGLLHAAQAKAVAGGEAIATLASERAANSILTSEVEGLRRERDELAARLAEIEAQEPVAWVPVHPRSGELWSNCTAAPNPERLPSYPLKPLYARPVPATPDGCGACGDACASRGACRLAEESPPASSVPAIPDGWKLVPVGPTIAMCMAGDVARITVDDPTLASATYRAMLAAAPEAQPGRGACSDVKPASPCRCGPDGCSDSVSCPRDGGAA